MPKKRLMKYSVLTPNEVESFRKEYKNALDEGKESFSFDSQEILVSYAKYVLEYYDSNNKKSLKI